MKKFGAVVLLAALGLGIILRRIRRDWQDA